MTERSTRIPEEHLGELPKLTDEEIDALEAENGLRQFDLMYAMMGEAPPGKPFKLTLGHVQKLQAAAIRGMDPAPGQFRSGPVYIGGSQHVPPPAVDVPALVVDMCETINNGTDPHQMAAYAMWRMNWIHPFTNGNGRTSRAVAYLVLCAKLGFRLPGKRTVPDMIASYKNPYYKALEAADAAWAAGNLDVSVMQSLMVDLLKKQLADV